jgi:squalene cyclase
MVPVPPELVLLPPFAPFSIYDFSCWARQTFVALAEDNQRKVLEFLGTLVLFPPDDTASNLNPGHPGADDMQDPAAHGSIALSALFQIASEGGE